MVDFSVPFDLNIVKKEEEKRGKYQDVAREVARMNAERVEVVLIVVDALEIALKELQSLSKMLRVGNVVGGCRWLLCLALLRF